MFGKCLIFTALLVIITVQLSQSQDSSGLMVPRPVKQSAAKCYTCNSVSSCRTPTIVTCDQKSANATRLNLAKYFSAVANLTNTQFECMKISYNLKNTTVFAVKGCVNVGVHACELHHKNISYTTRVCGNCNKNLCNPAGTFSANAATMMSATLGLLLLKCLYF